MLVELDTSVERAQLASSRAQGGPGDADGRPLARARQEQRDRPGAARQRRVAAQDGDAPTSTRSRRRSIARSSARPSAGGSAFARSTSGSTSTRARAITVLEAIDTVYVDFTLPQQRLGEIKVGMPVRVTIEGAEGVPRDGTIAAVDPAVDSTTRTIKLRASGAQQGRDAAARHVRQRFRGASATRERS